MQREPVAMLSNRKVKEHPADRAVMKGELFMSREEVIQYGGPAAMVGGAMHAGALGSILKGANQNEVLRVSRLSRTARS